MLSDTDTPPAAASASWKGSSVSCAVPQVKKCKLSLFPSTFTTTNEEILLHQDDFPDVAPGDIMEIYHPELDQASVMPRLLLQVIKYLIVSHCHRLICHNLIFLLLLDFRKQFLSEKQPT